MSHNIKRMPVRLRVQAQNEMDVAPPKGSTTLKRHRKNKRRPSYLLRDYARRQKTNVWLETHIWHAKRFKMANLWGYKIALHPSDRSVRACYRASAHICTIHDASYMTCIELLGQEKNILALLRDMTDPTDPFSVASRPCLQGKRSAKLMLYHPGSFPMGAIAPVSLLWRPQQQQESTPEGDDNKRQLWVWVHPSASAELLQAFHQLAAPHQVVWNSLKDQLVRFELTGPHCHTILTSTLRLAASRPLAEDAMETDSKSTGLWTALQGLRTPASLPTGAVLALEVEDPRVAFPPVSINKTIRARDQSRPSQAELAQQDQVLTQALAGEWPAEAVVSALWDQHAREALAKGFYSDAEAVKRKKAQPLFPGLGPKPSTETANADTTSFARLPLLLIQRPAGLQRGFGAGWDVILPARWGMPFWKSFIYAGARSIGLREHRKQASEQALPHFPEDYPDTNAYHAHIQAHAQVLMETYYKKPPAKRPNYDKLAVDSPFFPDFYSLLSLPLPPELIGEDEDENEEEDDDGDDQVEVEGTEEPDERGKAEREDKGKDKMEEDPTLIQMDEAGEDDDGDDDGDDAGEFIPQPFSVSRGRQPLVGATSLVGVSLRMVDRGVPHYNALICLPTEDDLALYRARAAHRRDRRARHNKPPQRRSQGEGEEEEKDEVVDFEDERGPLASLHEHGERQVIGFVTTGEYSYIRGSGSALGFCAATALFSNSAPPVVLVRNPSSAFYFPAKYSYMQY